MAKNIYRKYRAVETFEYRDIFRDRNYNFQADNSYTLDEKDLISNLQSSKTEGKLSCVILNNDEKMATKCIVDENSKTFTLSGFIYNSTWRVNSNIYVNLNSLKQRHSDGYTLAPKSGKTGYESGSKTIIKFYRGEADNDNFRNQLRTAEWKGIVHIEKVSTGYERGEYIEEVEAEEGTYPLEQNYNGYWYEYDRPSNYAPQISGSDYDMGSKTGNFEIEYYVSDQNDDAINVKILLDDIQKETKKVFNNQKNIYTVNLQDLNLGSHTVKIIAIDSFGATDTRTYTFYKSNTAPIISGRDEDLGGKSLGFTITYDITDSDGDEIDVTISLNNEELSNITTNSKNGLSFTLSDDKVKALTIGDIYTITIKADDRKGGIAYRRYTFTKTNSVPVISGNDKDLGEKSEVFTHSFSVTDYEKDPISFVVKLDGKVIKEVEEVEDGQDYQIEISHDEFMKLSYGKHTIKIEAWDSINADKIQKRELTFTRVSNGLDVEIKVATSKVQPKKIIAVPHGIFAPDATLQVLVCNNYLDAEPTWEDSTSMSKIARAYAFTNDVKEGDQWAIGIKIVVENGESGEVSILKGVKGGFE